MAAMVDRFPSARLPRWMRAAGSLALLLVVGCVSHAELRPLTERLDTLTRGAEALIDDPRIPERERQAVRDRLATSRAEFAHCRRLFLAASPDSRKRSGAVAMLGALGSVPARSAGVAVRAAAIHPYVLGAFAAAAALSWAIREHARQGHLADALRSAGESLNTLEAAMEQCLPFVASRRNPAPSSRNGSPVPISPGTGNRGDRDRCRPRPVPHAGGDALHDLCADNEPPNRFTGYDVIIAGVRFDAMDPSGALWEIKTGSFSSWPDFVQDEELRKIRVQFERERNAARDCKRIYVFAAADNTLLDEVEKQQGAGSARFVHLPQCARR